MESSDDPIASRLIIIPSIVPRFGWPRDDEFQTDFDAPGDISDQEADYGDLESHVFISAPAQTDTVASPRIIEAPNVSEASSPLPPFAPDIPQPVFVEHPLGPEGTIRDYLNYRCEQCGKCYCVFFVRPSSDPDENACAACGAKVYIV